MNPPSLNEILRIVHEMMEPAEPVETVHVEHITDIYDAVHRANGAWVACESDNDELLGIWLTRSARGSL